MLTLDESAACDSTQRVNVSDALTVHLSENPTTGFRWEIAVGDGLTIMSNDFARGSGSALGAGGARTVVIRAERAGDWLVKATLRRTGEAEAAQRRCNFTIRVTSVT
jgi:inhibitor of cysteine peptidase